MNAIENSSHSEHSRPIEENFNKIMWLWFLELISDVGFQATLVFGNIDRVKAVKGIRDRLYCEKKQITDFKNDLIKFLDASNFTYGELPPIEFSIINTPKKSTQLVNELNNLINGIDSRIEYLGKELSYFVEHNNIPDRNYAQTPSHFAKMICVGFELFPPNRKGRPYLELYKGFLEDEDKLASALSKHINLEQEGYEVRKIPIQWKDFLKDQISATTDKDTGDEDIHDWRKRTKEKYERILLSNTLNKDIKSKTHKEWGNIKKQINNLKGQIKKNLSQA